MAEVETKRTDTKVNQEAGGESETKTEAPEVKEENDSIPESVTPSTDKKASNSRVRVRSGSPSTRSGGDGGTTAPSASVLQAVSAASLGSAAQVAASLHLNGLVTLLTQSSSLGSSGGGSGGGALSNILVSEKAAGSSSVHGTWNIPTGEQVRHAANKAVQECPPFVHLSRIDSAPQLKITDDRRLGLKGGMRGYRMARATHGVSSGCYYYEVWVLPPPSVSEISESLPPNARLGKSLQTQIQQALAYEERQKQIKDENAQSAKSTENGGTTSEPTRKRRKTGAATAAEAPPPQVGGHLRIGWSMRTGDLQAPVGYDKWSYAFRSIGGSKIHKSKREDSWGGESWGEGDIVGCAICLGEGGNNNHIRFFKNGKAMGQFVITKGKREGGTAFEGIEDGTYYPAISSYLGGSVKVNFGPHFVISPKKLPNGLKLKPVSDLCAPPILEEDAVARLKQEKIFRKADMTNAFKDAVLAEVQVLNHSALLHQKKHLEEVMEYRQARNLSVTDVQQELQKLQEDHPDLAQ